MGNLNS